SNPASATSRLSQVARQRVVAPSLRRFDPASRYVRVAHRKSGDLQNRVRGGSIPSSPATIDLDVHNVLGASRGARCRLWDIAWKSAFQLIASVSSDDIQGA